MKSSLERAKSFLKTSAPRPKNEQGGEQAMFDAAVGLNDAISNFLTNPPEGTDPGVMDALALLQETVAGALDELLAPMVPEQPQQGGLEPTTVDQYPGMTLGESRHSRVSRSKRFREAQANYRCPDCGKDFQAEDLTALPSEKAKCPDCGVLSPKVS